MQPCMILEEVLSVLRPDHKMTGILGFGVQEGSFSKGGLLLLTDSKVLVHRTRQSHVTVPSSFSHLSGKETEGMLWLSELTKTRMSFLWLIHFTDRTEDRGPRGYGWGRGSVPRFSPSRDARIPNCMSYELLWPNRITFTKHFERMFASCQPGGSLYLWGQPGLPREHRDFQATSQDSMVRPCLYKERRERKHAQSPGYRSSAPHYIKGIGNAAIPALGRYSQKDQGSRLS